MKFWQPEPAQTTHEPPTGGGLRGWKGLIYGSDRPIQV